MSENSDPKYFICLIQDFKDQTKIVIEINTQLPLGQLKIKAIKN